MKRTKAQDTDFLNIKMTFGQYKGLVISKMKDKNYIEWALYKSEIKLVPEIKYALWTRLQHLK